MERDHLVVQDARQYLCMNASCDVGTWMVSPVAGVAALWRISHVENGNYLVAAERPICPFCGTNLLTHLDLEGGTSALDAQDTGPIFAFLRTLHEGE